MIGRNFIIGLVALGSLVTANSGKTFKHTFYYSGIYSLVPAVNRDTEGRSLERVQISLAVLGLAPDDSFTRRTEAVAEEAAATNEEQEEQPQHSVHLIAEDNILPANCDGCGMDIAIIDSPTCNNTAAYDNSIKVALQDALKYKTNENGSTDGWISQFFRERQLEDGDESRPAVTLADVLAVSTELIEAVNLFADKEYKIAVYLHDTDEEPVACAALEPASEEDAKMYEEMFYGDEGDEGGEGGDGSAATGDVPVGANSSHELLISTVMVGMTMLMSAFTLLV